MWFADTFVPQHPLVTVVQDVGELQHWENLLLQCAARGFISWDTETSGFDWWGSTTKHREGGARAIGHCVGYDLHDGHGPRGVYFPIRHQTIDRQLPVDAVTSMIQKLLGNPAHNVATHFGKFDWHFAEVDGIDVKATIHDCRIMAHLLDENRPMALEALVEQYNLDPNPYIFKKVVADQFTKECKRYDCKKRKAPGYQWIPVPVLGPYGAWDARLTLLLAYRCFPEVQQHYWGLYGVETAVLRSIQHAEHRGVPINVPLFDQMSIDLTNEAQQLVADIHRLAGYAVDPRKDAEVRELIYGHMRVPVEHFTDKAKYTPDGREIRTPAVGVVALSYIKHKINSPIIEKLLEFRKVSKLVSTYTLPIPAACDANGWLHGRMDPTGTVAGRFSSRDPNLQNIPADDPKHPERSIRRGFLVPEGKTRLCLDWSQIELRVLAVEAQEPTMLRAFNAGEDLHAQTSNDMFGNVIKTNRTIAKRINFGISYGLSPIGLMHQLNKEADPDNGVPFVTEKQAEGWFDRWRSKYPRVPLYMDDLVKECLCKNPPQYTNAFGRTRRIPQLRALGSVGRRAARQLIASRIQGGAAELTKVSIVRVQQIIDWARAEGRWEGDLALTIHDEIQVDVDNAGAREAALMFKAAMEDFPQISDPGGGRQGVPVVCDVESTTTNWAAKQDMVL